MVQVSSLNCTVMELKHFAEKTLDDSVKKS